MLSTQSTRSVTSATWAVTSHSAHSQPARTNISPLSDLEPASDFAPHCQQKSPNTLESPRSPTIDFRMLSFSPTWQPLVIKKRHSKAKVNDNDKQQSPRVTNYSHPLPAMLPPAAASPEIKGRAAATTPSSPPRKQSLSKSLEDHFSYLMKASPNTDHSKGSSPTSSLTSSDSPRSVWNDTPTSTSPGSTNTSASSSGSKHRRRAMTIDTGATGDYSPTLRRFTRVKGLSPTNSNTTTSMGLPDDMLDVLDGLESLAKDVEGLKLKKRPSLNERCLKAISSSTRPFTRSLKEKWRKRSSLVDMFSAESDVSIPYLRYLSFAYNKQPKISPPNYSPPRHEWLYNPKVGPHIMC